MANNEFFDGARQSVKSRTATIRLRTWTLTLAIIVALCFYLLVNVGFNAGLNPIDFCLIVVLQVILYCLYFPEGELFGQKSTTFIANKKTYNEKATMINQKHLIGSLREYCKIEYERRKKEYITNECGHLGITPEELELLRSKTPKEIDKLETWEVQCFDKEGNADGSKLIIFDKGKRRRLSKLLFKELPVEENHAETILSAVENHGNHAIKDQSIPYKTRSYIKKFLIALVVGGIFAYIGYTLRDGIGLPEIVSIISYICTMFTTAVMAFTSGEKCSKVYKNNFYVELYNFIDGFFEWVKIPEETKGE